MEDEKQEELEREARLKEEAERRKEEEEAEYEQKRKEEEENYRKQEIDDIEHKCAYCLHLDPSKKSEGRYYCDKKYTYVKGTDTNRNWNCRDFEESARSSLESDLIYEDSDTLDNHSGGIINNRFCCDCFYYDVDKKAGDGCYKCSKRDQDMYADTPECYMFEPSGRSARENERMYDDAKRVRKESEYAKTNSDMTLKIIFVIILIIGAIIVNVFL